MNHLTNAKNQISLLGWDASFFFITCEEFAHL